MGVIEMIEIPVKFNPTVAGTKVISLNNLNDSSSS